MKATNETTTAGAKSIPETKRDPHLSSDGKWRSFPRVPNLLQYVIAGTYYARCKVNGKPVRASLETDVWTTAKQKLPDKLKELRKPKAIVGTFEDGRLKYEAETQNGYTNNKGKFIRLSPLSKVYRLRCLENLRRTLVQTLFHAKPWKELTKAQQKAAFARLDAVNAKDFTKAICESWQGIYAEYAPSFFNNTVNTFRRVLELAGLPHDDNQAYGIGRLAIVEKSIELPRPEQFDRIIELVENSGAGQSKDSANLIRFLAFTGARLTEAKRAVWSDVNWQDNTMLIHSVKVRGTQDATRVIPLNPALKQLLERLRHEHNPKPGDNINRVFECQKSLNRACKLAGCKRIVHHDLRHYFITKCLQAGVDVFTLSKWVGHHDGGKLLLKVYSHLQSEHSQSQAAKVTFGAAPLPENVVPLDKAASRN